MEAVLANNAGCSSGNAITSATAHFSSPLLSLVRQVFGMCSLKESQYRTYPIFNKNTGQSMREKQVGERFPPTKKSYCENSHCCGLQAAAEGNCCQQGGEATCPPY